MAGIKMLIKMPELSPRTVEVYLPKWLERRVVRQVMKQFSNPNPQATKDEESGNV